MFKPRCVYSETSLKREEKQKLTELEEDYTCGSILFPPASPYHSSIITRANLLCRDPVEPQYYSATLVKFPPVCSHCGAPEGALVEDEVVRDLKQRKQVVRPICFLCRSDGLEPHTWGATSNILKRGRLLSLFCTSFFIFVYMYISLLEVQLFEICTDVEVVCL